MNRFLLAILLATLASGCVSPSIQTSSTIFHGEGNEARGTIGVAPLNAAQEKSLEFKMVSEYVQKKLVQKGYVDGNWKSSDYMAYVTYGIDTGRTTSANVPIYGQTGGGTSYSSGTVSSGAKIATYSGTTYTMPTYGVVGAMPVNTTTYRRVVNIDVFRWNGGKDPVKVYEMRGVSTGACGNINAVVLHIIDGMFANFPGENGKTRFTEELVKDFEC